MSLRYRYNEQSCRYEPIVVSPRLFVKDVLRFIGISFLLGVAGIIYYNTQYPLVDEVKKKEENARLKSEWQGIHAQLAETSQQLTELESNDDHNFRVILDMDPLSSTQREAGVGGRERASANISYPIISTAVDLSEKIKNRLTVEEQSINKLKSTLRSKEKQWASRPAIQPINNKELIHLYLVFGERFLPQDGYSRQHNGLDFAAPYNSPIYATGDGIVTYANGGTTYGNVVFVSHGYGFETRYAHMSKFIVSVGQKVKRGQVLGYVGDTGHSFGNHLHYEVLYQTRFVNPISFFQRDLNNKEYERLISLGSRQSVPLD